MTAIGLEEIGNTLRGGRNPRLYPLVNGNGIIESTHIARSKKSCVSSETTLRVIQIENRYYLCYDIYIIAGCFVVSKKTGTLYVK